MAETLYASFRNPSQAEQAIAALLDHGAREQDVSLVSSESYQRGGPTDYRPEKDAPEHNPVKAAAHGVSTTTMADAGAGAAKGAGVGLGLGAVAALASLFVPGVGLITGGGALAAALGGTAAMTAAGAVAGGVVGYLKDQGVPEEAAHRYGRAIASGGALIAVHLPSGSVDRALADELLAKYHGTDADTYTGLP